MKPKVEGWAGISKDEEMKPEKNTML